MQQSKYDYFFEAQCYDAYKLFGAHKTLKGVRFTVYAPHAHKIDVIGSFNDWQSGTSLNKIDERGIWELEIPGLDYKYSYKYRIYQNDNYFHDKIDPYAYYAELRPNTASVMYDMDQFKFSDDDYIKTASKANHDLNRPMNIYEVHANAFFKPADKELASYKDLEKHLLPYVVEHGFTHIELMPLFEYPFDGSWGYQSTGFYATTSRYGNPDDLRSFINACHLKGVKVIFDAVYTHFVKDTFALVNYDHHPLYEASHHHLGQSQWDTYYFDLANPTVMSFLMSSAHFFAEYYHIDGIRFDAVSHFLYYQGNSDLGENLAGINFLKRLNFSLHTAFPRMTLIAEDSSSYPFVTKDVAEGGIGFDYKWDLGWMNDTLRYYSLDPIYKKWHHNLITFSMAYFYNEKFILPFSHDEVVHSKKTIIDKMFGSYEDKFALAKNLYIYMFTHPGKKLNFMGNELAVFSEFDETREVEWHMLKYPRHDSFKRFFKDLGQIYCNHPSLYQNDYDYNYFKWIEVDNADLSIFSFYREAEKEVLVTVLNMTGCSYDNYQVGVPYPGVYQEIINADRDIYTGNNFCNLEPLQSKYEINTYQKQDYSINIKLPPFGAMIFYLPKTTKTIKTLAFDREMGAKHRLAIQKQQGMEALKAEAKSTSVKD